MCLDYLVIVRYSKDTASQRANQSKEVRKLRLPDNRDGTGELLTLTQACQIFNLGEQTVRRLAAESGAVRKIGKSYRIRKELFLQHIDNQYSVL